jgi:hypothetical protein
MLSMAVDMDSSEWYRTQTDQSSSWHALQAQCTAHHMSEWVTNGYTGEADYILESKLASEQACVKVWMAVLLLCSAKL